MNKNDLKDKKWFLVSYDSLRTSLVGGNRINRLNKYLQQEGIDSTLISREISPKEGIRVEDLRLVRFGKKMLGGGFIVDPSILWAFRVYRLLRHEFSNIVLLSSQPPFGVSYLGLICKFFKRDLFWIADFRDPWTLNPLYNPFPFGKLFSKFYERKVFENADLIIFNTKTDKDNHCQKFKYLREKSIVVRNGFGEVISNISSTEKGKKLKIVYSGGAYPRASAANNVVQFTERINKAGYEVVCDYYGEYDSILSKSDYVNYKGKISQTEVPRVLSNYRFGLIYLPEENLGGGRVTQKFYDYIGSGVSPIVINPSKEMLNMMSRLKTGIVLFSKTDIESAIPILKAESEKKMPSIEEGLIKQYTNEYQFEKLLDYFENN